MPDHNLPPDALSPRYAAAAPAGGSMDEGRLRRHRWLLALAAFAVLGLGGAAALLRNEIAAVPGHRTPVTASMPPAPAEPPPALTVSVAPAVQRPRARVVVGDGSVVAWQELVIGAEMGGLRVAEVAVEEGDAVRRGQLLVRLEDSLLVAQRDQARAAVEEAEAALRVAQQDLVRSVELSGSQTAARQTLEQREAAARQAEARLAQARILAPTDGVVSRRATLVGAVTAVGQEMVRLIHDNRLELDARVPELELAAVRAGQRARVFHGDRTIEAAVRAVAPTVSAETRLGTVHVALPPGSGLRPGMFARAEILPEAAPALTVPQEAILFREGRPAAFVVSGDGDRVSLRPLVTGRRREGVVEVTEGLAPGERVVVSGAGFLSDGDRVRVAVDDRQAAAAR